MRKPNSAELPERQRKVCGYLYTAGDVQEPQKTTKPFLAAIRDSKGRMHLKIMPPSRPTRGGRSRWRSPSSATIKRLRTSAHLTQVQAAAISCSAVRSWQDWESGRRLMHPALFHVFDEGCTALGSHWVATAQKLRGLREEAKITEVEAAALCLASLRTWHAWESGREPMPPSLYRLFFEKLADSYPIESRP
jgi:DNA-binding transcriptional regulator YiaG